MFNCKKDDPKLIPLLVKYGTSFGMCVGYCNNNITLQPGVVTYTRQGNSGTPSPITCTGTLDENSWNSIKTGLNVTTFFNLPETIGCPDCADGGAEWIEITLINGETHKVVFEYNNAPAPLNDYSIVLRSLMSTSEENCP